MLLLALTLLASPPPDVSGTYRLEAPTAVKVKKGAAATVHIEVVPRSDAHVSPDAPISLSVHSSGPGVAVAKEKLVRADAKMTAQNGVSFDVPLTATSSEAMKASLRFFICTEKLCESQRREIDFPVQVE
jgi:hypothetical protein